MSAKQRDFAAIELEATKFEMISGLERALDVNYRRLINAAKSEWEERFAGQDPSDACVGVHIRAAHDQARAVRGSGFLKAGQPSRSPKRQLSFPRFAR